MYRTTMKLHFLVACLAVVLCCGVFVPTALADTVDTGEDANVPSTTIACGRAMDIEDLPVKYWWSLEEFSISDKSVLKWYYYEVYDDEYDDDETYIYIKALKPGTATLLQEDGTPIITINVKAAKITRKGSASFKLKLNGSKKLSVSSSPAKPGIKWKSTKSSVVSVNSSGKITARGAGKATISATARYGNTVKWKIRVAKVRASKVTIKKIPTQLFPKKAKKPKLTIKYNGKKLKKGRDYKVKYKNNKKPGIAKAIVTFKGSYKGKRTAKFKILNLKMGKPKITYWDDGIDEAYIEWKSGSNSTGTQLVIYGSGTDKPYKKHIPGQYGYGWWEYGDYDEYATFYIRAYKKIDGERVYGKWVKKVIG